MLSLRLVLIVSVLAVTALAWLLAFALASAAAAGDRRAREAEERKWQQPDRLEGHGK